MGKDTAIEWCDATFNIAWGCTKVGPGCDNCYAETWAKRLGMALWGTDAPRRTFGPQHWDEPLRWDRDAGERGVRMRVFCSSMADVFENHPALPAERSKLWSLIEETQNLDWLLLTKRIGNVTRMVPSSWLTLGWPKHAWLGATVVNQEEADRDIPKLLAIPARVRFLSCEPLLGPIDLGCAHRTQEKLPNWPHPTRVDWVISGGESGAKARPSHPDWHRSLRDQCAAAGVPFMFKQWGAWWPISQMRDGESDGFYDPKYGKPKRDKFDSSPPKRAARTTVLQLEGTQEFAFPAGAMTCYQVGKKAAGRVLDGRTHDEFPA